LFIGHFAVGFGSKAIAPAVSLGTLFLAAQFADLLWPLLLQLGVEQVAIVPEHTEVTPLDFVHYPISHSLLTLIGWGAVLGLVYFLARRSMIGAVVVGLLVVSHWVLDLVVHIPDLPVYPGGPRVGLGLWQSLAVTMMVEVPLFAGGVWLYLRSTTARNWIGRFGVWGLVLLLVVVYFASVLGPPPPDVTTLAWVGHLQWLIVALGYVVDRHRIAAAPPGHMP
jgi:hypothetical protein